MRLLATGLRLLNLSILALEAPSLLLGSHRLLHEVVRPVSFVDSSTVKFRRAFDDRACLRERWDFSFAIVLLVMPVWIEDRSHLDELKVTLQLGSQIGFGQVEPVGTSRNLIVLLLSVHESPNSRMQHKVVVGEESE